MLVRQSISEDADNVGRRLAPLWRVLNDRLRAEFIDNEDTVLSINVHSESLCVGRQENEIVLPAFEFAPIGHEHLCTIAPKAYAPRSAVEELARAATLMKRRNLGTSSCDGRLFASSRPCRPAERGRTPLWRFAWVADGGCLLPFLLPGSSSRYCQLGERGPFHEADICTVAAHSFDVR